MGEEGTCTGSIVLGSKRLDWAGDYSRTDGSPPVLLKAAQAQVFSCLNCPWRCQ